MDNPRIWIVATASGQPLAVWCSDEPVGDDTICPVKLSTMPPGATVYKFSPGDLSALNLPAADVALADSYIAANGMKAAHLPYRALQLHSGDDAPSTWILDNCRISAGKIGRFSGTPEAAFDTPTDPAKETPGMLSKIWRGIVNLLP